MLHEYTPYLDDGMTRSFGNVDYKRDVKHQAREAALNAYKNAMRSSTYPYYSEFGLPVGKGIKNAKKMILTANPMISERKLVKKLAKMGSQKHFIKYQLMKGGKLTVEQRSELARKTHTGAKNVPGTLYHWPKGYYEDPELRKIGYEEPELFGTNYKVKYPKTHKKALKQYYYELTQEALAKGEAPPIPTRYPSLPPPLPPRGTGIAEKYMKYKMFAKSGDPTYIAKKKAYKRLMNGGLIAARGIEARGISARGVIQARPAGGFVGMSALASLATPLVIEGVKALGKLIKRKIKGSGDAEGMWLPSVFETDKVPKGAYSFWRQVYKLAAKQIPVFFKDKDTASVLAKNYLEEHSRHMFNEFKNVVMKTKTKGPGHSPLTISDILEPIILNHAKEKGIAPEEAKKVIELPQLAVPAGEGIFDTIMNIAKNPEVQQFVGSAAKKILPAVGKKISSFARGKLGKWFGRNRGDKMVDLASSAISAVASNPKIKVLLDQSSSEGIDIPFKVDLVKKIREQYGDEFTGIAGTHPVIKAVDWTFLKGNLTKAQRKALKQVKKEYTQYLGPGWLKKLKKHYPVEVTYASEDSPTGVPDISATEKADRAVAQSPSTNIIKAREIPATPVNIDKTSAIPMTETTAMPYGTGVNTADAFTRGGRMAARVYRMAKKTNSRR